MAAQSHTKLKIVSGGQTGVDRAALDVAIELGIPHGGWCPRGRLAEDGIIPSIYLLQETPDAVYGQRTEWNVRDSDATLILTWGPPTGGTGVTVHSCINQARPHFLWDLSTPSVERVVEWLKSVAPSILNIAGPRESFRTGVGYRESKKHLKSLLKRYKT